VAVKNVGAAELPDGAPQLKHSSDIARSGRAIDIDRGHPVAVPRMLREASGELRLGATRRVDDEDVEPQQWQAFGDVEHVLADPSTCCLADEHDAKHALITRHIASARARPLTARLIATITEYGMTNRPNVFRIP
jgi:hypothetical protein